MLQLWCTWAATRVHPSLHPIAAHCVAAPETVTVAGWCPLGFIPSCPPQCTPMAYSLFLSSPLPRQVVIHSLADAHEEVDKAISAAVFHSKPVYICVCCNLAGGLLPWLGFCP